MVREHIYYLEVAHDLCDHGAFGSASICSVHEADDEVCESEP